MSEGRATVGTDARGRVAARYAPTPRHLDVSHAISMTRYAHGEIRISYYPVQTHKRARRVSKAVAGSLNPYSPVEQEDIRQLAIERAVDPVFLDSRSKFQGISGRWPKVRRLPRKKIFRSQARRQILECAAVAEEKFGKNCVMFTATVPGSGWRIAATVAKYSGKILNRIKQIFRDNLKEEYALFGVWEWQKRGMLHLHIAVATNETEKLEKLRQVWKERWIALLMDISFEAGRDLFRKNASWTWQDDLDKVQCDASWVEKSIGTYLSKYVSKEARGRATGKFFAPTKWTTVSRKIAAEARDRRVKGKRAGFDLQAVKSFIATWKRNFGAQVDKEFLFLNQQFPACGGITVFAEKTRSELVAVDFLDLLQEFSILSARSKTA